MLEKLLTHEYTPYISLISLIIIFIVTIIYNHYDNPIQGDLSIYDKPYFYLPCIILTSICITSFIIKLDKERNK